MSTQPMNLSRQIAGLIGWLLLCFAVSGIGAIASVQASRFYAALTQPGWAPPAGVFGPVWSTLFGMMAVSAWLVWRHGGLRANRLAFSLFGLQLAVNALWSWLFFAWHLGGAAFVDILILWPLIAATSLLFWRVSTVAGLLMLPYLAWVGFAGLLNFSVWQLNPGLL